MSENNCLPNSPEPSNTPKTAAEVDAAQIAAIKTDKGDVAYDLELQHPNGEFQAVVVQRTKSLGGYAVNVLQKTRDTVARMVRQGQIRTLQQFRKRLNQVFAMNVRHFRSRLRKEDRSDMRLLGDHAEDIASPQQPPETAMLLAELLPVFLNGARQLGYVGFRVVREFRRFEETNQKRHGAYPFLARLAIVDGAGRIVAFRRPSPDLIAISDTPTKKLIHDVRKLHRESMAKLRVIARGLGFNVPPLD
jgi:hypothetical protein